MSYVANNPAKEELFQDKWRQEIAKIIRSGKKAPDFPGHGWLAGIAAHYNLCSAVFKMPNGSYSVCGRSLSKQPSPDAYLCQTCFEMREKIKAKEKEQAKELKEKIKIFTEESLSF